ncbi:CDP-diacylglycerol--glycerol-3-phosphate 3-phosphatidyltransferase [Georgenia halophila]|uniref:CDP-diacylglycerol--glycerol-3-phosphate 3-phosphatidyltransferase n=1 Tax=Georgenia halophila TaxID=620889 RepID=A0ABP8L679_9MICO
MTTDPATNPASGSPAPVPLWNIANVLTMVRILMVPVFIVLFLQGTTGAQVAATLVFAAAAATDKLDGTLARRHGLVTNFGKLADPIADKALVISALVLLSMDGLLWWWVTIVIIVRELGITLLRFVMMRRAVMAASKGGKTKTVLQIAFILMLLVPWDGFLTGALVDVILLVALVVVLLALAVTVLTGVDYVVKAVQIASSGRRADADDRQSFEGG